MKRALAWLSGAWVLLAAGAAGATVPPLDEPALGSPVRHRRDVDRLGWYVPDFARLQTGGYLGAVGIGGGYAVLNDILNVSFLYGFTPAAHAGENVHELKLALDVRPLDVRWRDFRLVPLYVGGGMLYVIGSEYFSRLPERFKRLDPNYYEQTALRWMAHLGVELDYLPARGAIERHGLYYECTTLDEYVEMYFKNPEVLDPWDAVSSTIGYRAAF